MSLIASFWTLPAEARQEIVAAFKPIEVQHKERSWLLFSKTRIETVYPWFDYMKKHARAESSFNHGGSAMVDFELIATEKAGAVFALGLPESDALSEHSGGSVALLDEAAAHAVISRLESFPLSEVDVVRFYESDARPPDWRCEPEAVLAAQRQLISWCKAVEPSRLGLLMVG